MSTNLLIGLSSLLLPLGFYGVPAQSSSYQRSYLSASINSFPEISSTNMAAVPVLRNVVMVVADDVEIVSASPIKELVIIDAAVQDKSAFYRAVKAGVEIVEIDSSQPGLSQLKQILGNYKNLTALHIISHATAGELFLGSSRVNAASLKQEVDTFSALKGALVDEADLFLYGCDLASGESGEELLEIIRSNTGLDVAASTNKTGNANSGGDWELEIQQGDIQNTLAFSPKALADFSGVLAPEAYPYNNFPPGAPPLLTSYDGTLALSGSSTSVRAENDRLYLDPISPTETAGFLQIAAVNPVVSFELTELRLGPLRGSASNLACSSAEVRGYTASAGSIVESITIPDSENIINVPLAAFSGQQIRHFKVSASGCESVGSSLKIVDFTVDNKVLGTAPTVSLSVSPSEIAEAAGTATVTATLSTTETVDTTVVLAASGGTATNVSDYSLSSNSIVIPAGQVTGTATVTAVQDSRDENNETIVLAISTVSGGDGATENGSQQVTVTINDDDPEPALSVADVSKIESSINNYMVFVVSLSAASGKTVTVNAGTSAGTAIAGVDYTESSSVLTFNPGQTSRNFLVLIRGDNTQESDENFTVTLSSPSNATLDDASATGTILDDDDSTPPAVTSVSVPSASTYSANAQLNFTVNFNEVVIVNTSGGTPRLALTLDSGTVYASYVSGTGSSALTFRYTVQNGDLDANGIALATAVDLNSGTIKDSAGNNAVATLNSAGSTVGVLIDAVAPAAPSTPDLDAGSDTGVSDTDNLTGDNTPTFTGTAEADAIVTIISSLSGNLGTAIADSSGNWSFTAGTMANGTYDITATATDAAGNVSSASGALTVTIDGPITVTSNSDSGGDAIIDGSLAADLVDGGGLSLREALAYVTLGSTVDFAVGLSGATISLGSPLTIPAGITLDADALGSATITGNTLSLAGNLSITNGSGDNLTLGGSLAGTGALTKSGNGKLTLTSTDNSTNHSGGVTVTAGELVIGSDSVFSSGTLTLNGGQLSSPNNANFNLDNPIVLGAAGGRVNLPGASTNVTLSGVVSGTGALSKINGGKLVLSGTNTFSGGLSVAGTNGVSVDSSANLGSGAVTLNSSTTLTLTGTAQTITNTIALAGDATIANANAMTISGVISSAGGLSKSGAGVLTLSGTNTATGTINVVEGGLALSGGSAVADTVPVTVNAGATLSLPTGNETIGSLAGAGNVVLSYRLTTGADNTSTTFSGVISSTNTSGITKSGSGTFKLTGDSTYSGSTQVSAGSLIVNGSNTASSDVTVASGATLGGTGTVPAVVISSGGNLSPGDSGVGVLSIANGLTINSGGNLLLDIAGTSAGTQHDQLAITGTAAVGGASLVVTHSYAATYGDSYTVITNDLSDSISGNFSGLAEGGVLVAGGNSSNLIASYVAGDGNDQSLTYTNLPGIPTAVTAVAGDGSASVTFTSPASNGGSAITGYIVTANPGGATVTGAGSPINFPGLTNGTAYTFTVRATNGSGNGLPSVASNAVTPSAPPVNTAPVITQGASTSVTMSEDGAPTAFALSLTATDSDNDTLTWSVSGAAQNGSASVSGGSVSYAPIPNFNGSDSFVVQVSDGEDTDSITVNVTVTPVNDAPVISGTPSTRLDQDTAYSFTPTASDIDTADVLTFSIINKPTWASFNTATGALTGTPAGTDSGKTIGIVISVSDGTTSTALPAFDIEVISTIDPLQPIVTAPAELNVDATGLFTPITLRQLLALNPNASQGDIDAVLKAMAKDGVSGNDCCTTTAEGLTATSNLLLAPGRHEIKWKATNAVGVSGEGVQVVNIWPLVSLSPSQIAVRGNEIEFRVVLNGPSPVYPLAIPYVVDAATTATAAEHNLSSGTATFTQPGQAEVVIPVALADVTGFSDSQLVIALGGGINAGANNRHSVDIRQGNVPPVVSVSITQGGINTSLVSPTGGPVTVTASVTDANQNDTHTFDWSATSGLADTDGDPTNASRTFDPTGVTGSNQLKVTVTDSGGASVQASAYFRVVSSLPVLDVNTDTDQDGISDSLEGTGDSDDNGIPDYLDSMPSSNVLPQQGTTTNAYLIECDPGVLCGLGLFARSGISGGAQILDQEINTLNGLVSDPAFEPVGGVFDFAIRNLPIPGQSVRIVIPQRAAIPANAVYRKYQGGRWVTFISDANNAVHSAAGNPGYCPPPGAADWTSGLTAGHMCVQLTIEDGGPNDDDGLVNSAVVDPGAVSQAKAVEPPEPKPPKEVKTGGGGGAAGAWLLLGLGLLAIRRVVNTMKAMKMGKSMKNLIALLTLGLVASGTQASPADKLHLRIDA